MYIDKLYTKLFSERNWSGLKQLVSEIRTFNYKQMGGMKSTDKFEHQIIRDQLADEVRRSRNDDPQVLDNAHALLARDKASRMGTNQRNLIDSIYRKGTYGGYKVTPESYWNSLDKIPDNDLREGQNETTLQSINALGKSAETRMNDKEFGDFKKKLLGKNVRNQR